MTAPETNEPAPPDKAAAKKNLWDTTITSTPVILTVIATLLAGMSASEMTWAQYHRATAAQNESRAAGQFGFFQAKRIRGTSMDLTTILLQTLSESDSFDAETVRLSAERLAEELEQAAQEAQGLERRIKDLKTAEAPGDDKVDPILNLQRNFPRLAEEIGKATQNANRLRNTTITTLNNGTEVEVGTGTDKSKARITSADLERAFGYLTRGLPKVKEGDLLDEIKPANAAQDIAEALKLAEDRQSEDKTRALMRRIPEPTLKEAYYLAEQRARNFEKANDALKPSFDVIKGLVGEQAELARGFHRSVRTMTRLLPAARSDEAQQLKGVRAGVAALASSDRTVKDSVGQLNRDYRVGVLSYEVRRYQAESRDNLKGAQLYQLLVRWSNAESDRHMDRKSLLFYAMLAAQAGVTVATLALAVRRKSIVWGLAAAAGAAAVTFGAYVAMTM